MDEEAEPEMPLLRSSTRAFLMLEHGVYAGLGALLGVLAVLALARAGLSIWHEMINWGEQDGILAVMDQLLFVLMLVEVLHTVRVSIRSGILNCEPFLVVGLIASIRRVLVIALQSSKTTQGTWNENTEHIFRSSMIELGVLAGLILVMVASIWVVRRERL